MPDWKAIAEAGRAWQAAGATALLLVSALGIDLRCAGPGNRVLTQHVIERDAGPYDSPAWLE